MDISSENKKYIKKGEYRKKLKFIHPLNHHGNHSQCPVYQYKKSD